jgi:nitrogen regulatory protein PII
LFLFVSVGKELTMITIFNRRELITLVSMQKMMHVREALSGAGIRSHTKTKGAGGFAGNRRHGVPCVNYDAAYTYTVYVRREDYDRAVRAIQPALQKH